MWVSMRIQAPGQKSTHFVLGFLAGGFGIVLVDSAAFRFEPALVLEVEDLELDFDASLSSLDVSSSNESIAEGLTEGLDF